MLEKTQSTNNKNKTEPKIKMKFLHSIQLQNTIIKQQCRLLQQNL
jgi:hypothetical protein